MDKKIILGPFFVCFHGCIEDGLEIGKRWRSGGWSLRHRKINPSKLVGDVRETERLSGQSGTSVFVCDRYKSLDGGRWGIASRVPDKQTPSEDYH